MLESGKLFESEIGSGPVRKGDLWYQLETALREVCVTIPEATVPEFERRVNELMLVSLGLAERRRRSRHKNRVDPPRVLPE